MSDPSLKYGSIPTSTFISMRQDYIMGFRTLKGISEHYKYAYNTIKRASSKHKWKAKKKEWDNRKITNGTTKRSHMVHNIIGKMMGVIDRHVTQVEQLSNNINVTNLIPDHVVLKAYKAMEVMDKLHAILKEARETGPVDKVLVIAEAFEYDILESRYNKGNVLGRKQLQEWEDDRNPSIKEKVPDDIFAAQAPKVKDDEEDITFEGLNDDPDDDSPIGGILG